VENDAVVDANGGALLLKGATLEENAAVLLQHGAISDENAGVRTEHASHGVRASMHDRERARRKRRCVRER
jgi:hypothetical protein